MKTLFVVLFCLLLTVNGLGQYAFIDFSSPTNLIEIDTTNPNNRWQIGRPQKIFLNSAYSSANAIITDTINNYPTNDTSAFVLKVPEALVARYSTGYSTGEIVIKFYTKYQTDSLKDFGRIEFSADSGATWHIMGEDYTDTAFSVWNPLWNVWTDGGSGWSFSDKAIYTGQSSGWEMQQINLSVCSVSHPKREEATNSIIGCHPQSIWLKFVFISDSIPDNLGGWAIDNINIDEIQFVGITEVKEADIKILPNPFISQLTISLLSNQQTTVVLYNFIGRQVLQQTFATTTTINTEEIASGMYFYELRNERGVFKTGKVVKQ